jgi:hypothetical protein
MAANYYECVSEATNIDKHAATFLLLFDNLNKLDPDKVLFRQEKDKEKGDSK